MAKRMTKQEALDRLKDLFKRQANAQINFTHERIEQRNLDAIKIAYKALQKEVDEEKAKIEYEPDMDRCHFIKNEYFIDTGEHVNWYIYNNIKIKEITDYLPWRYEVIYNDIPYVYLSLESACKFIENNITL